MIRVLLKQDQCLWSTALARGLAQEQGMDVVANLRRSEDVVLVGQRVRPDVVVFEVGLIAYDALESMCAALPESSVLILIDARNLAAVQADLARLVPRVGFVTTGETFEQFIEAIRRLTRGEAVIDTGVALAALKARENPLTTREQEVLTLIVTGATTKEIADKLYLRVGTVRNYLSSAIHKSGGRTRIDAVRIAQEAGWI